MYRLQYYIFITDIFVCYKAPKNTCLKMSALIVISCAYILMGVGARVRNLTVGWCAHNTAAQCAHSELRAVAIELRRLNLYALKRRLFFSISKT